MLDMHPLLELNACTSRHRGVKHSAMYAENLEANTDQKFVCLDYGMQGAGS